jgi:hypothetical protein
MVGEHSIDVAMARLDVATVLSATLRHEEAETLARMAEHSLIANLGPASSMVVLARVSVADALRGLGRFSEAEPLIEAAVDRFRVETPFNAQWRRTTLGAMARLREAQGRINEAQHYRAMLRPDSTGR